MRILYQYMRRKARESYPFIRLSFIIRKVSFLLRKRNSLKYNFQKLDSFVHRSFVQLCSCKKKKYSNSAQT